MRIFNTAHDPLHAIHAALTQRDEAQNQEIDSTVQRILDDVRARGDAAVLDYTRRYDWPNATIKEMSLSEDDLEMFETQISTEDIDMMDSVMANILAFHSVERGHLQSWIQPSTTGPATLVGQILQPVQRVGIYVPGGKASYPSTVLMAAIPAFVAGVEEVILCTPPNGDGAISPHVGFAAARWVKTLHKIGGAQAIAAMAYGTESVPKCDIIVGPGNQYVNAAKRLIFGAAGIDMLAGPSEVAIIADEGANPAFIAADLLAQTEHGPDNHAALFCHSSEIIEKCQNELSQQSVKLSRQEILKVTANNIIFVKTNSLTESIELSNHLAPEHLELMARNPLDVLPLIKNAGAILLGDYASAPLGDYWAGPSHTLPTAGSAKFSSPLSVASFMKRSSVIYYSQEAAQAAAVDISRFATIEGFDGHAAAARLRAF